MLLEQDTHLDSLHSSLTRQHSLSQELSSELDVQAGLLTELDTDVDNTTTRLGQARRSLDTVGRGLGANGKLSASNYCFRCMIFFVDPGSTVTIAALILVLLILIVVFKT